MFTGQETQRMHDLEKTIKKRQSAVGTDKDTAKLTQEKRIAQKELDKMNAELRSLQNQIEHEKTIRQLEMFDDQQQKENERKRQLKLEQDRLRQQQQRQREYEEQRRQRQEADRYEQQVRQQREREQKELEERKRRERKEKEDQMRARIEQQEADEIRRRQREREQQELYQTSLNRIRERDNNPLSGANGTPLYDLTIQSSSDEFCAVGNQHNYIDKPLSDYLKFLPENLKEKFRTKFAIDPEAAIKALFNNSLEDESPEPNSFIPKYDECLPQQFLAQYFPHQRLPQVPTQSTSGYQDEEEANIPVPNFGRLNLPRANPLSDIHH